MSETEVDLRRLVVLAAVIAFVAVPPSFGGTSTAAPTGNWLKSAFAAKKAAAPDKMIFVDLFANWCGWCHKFESDVIPTSEFQKATSKMVLLRLNTEDGADGTAFAQTYSVTSLPTFLILNSDMTIVGFIRGYAPAPEFVKMLEGTVGKYRDFQKTVANESSLQKDYDKRLWIAKEFMTRMNFAQSEPRLRKLTTEKGVPVDIRDQAYYQLGAGYMLQGRLADVTKTIDAFSKVQKEGESYERARLLATDVCIAQGNLKCAANELRTFKEEFPHSPFIPNIDMMLPSLERQLNTKQQ